MMTLVCHMVIKNIILDSAFKTWTECQDLLRLCMTDDRDETPTQETLLENEWFKQEGSHNTYLRSLHVK